MYTVLFYHHLSRRPRRDHPFFRNSLSVDDFRAQMTRLRERRHPLTPEEFRDCFRRRSFPKDSVLITFDDGFRSDLIAASVLQELGMSAIFFTLTDTFNPKFKPWYLRFAHAISTRRKGTVASPWGTCDFAKSLQRRRWMYQAKEYLLACNSTQRDEELARLSESLGSTTLPSDDEDYAFNTEADLRRLTEMGMAVGCHSASHDDLSRRTVAELNREVLESADILERATGCRISFFSYPDGRHSPLVREVVGKRFELSFCTNPRSNEYDSTLVPRRAADGYVPVDQVFTRKYVWRSYWAPRIKSLLFR